MPKIVLISDTHNKLDQIDVPDGDILIHCGDATARGSPQEIERFAETFAALPHQHKLFVAGNHDWGFERNRFLCEGILGRAGGIQYLQDSEVTVEGLRCYGSPWQPRFYDWAFNVDRGPKLRAIWQKIPAGIDILITHGPPMGVLDRTDRGEHVGCDDLAAELVRIVPRLHCFGHIHCAYGTVVLGDTTYVNASNLNERYNVANQPVVIYLEPK